MILAITSLLFFAAAILRCRWVQIRRIHSPSSLVLALIWTFQSAVRAIMNSLRWPESNDHLQARQPVKDAGRLSTAVKGVVTFCFSNTDATDRREVPR